MVTHPGTNLAQPGLALCSWKAKFCPLDHRFQEITTTKAEKNNALNRLVFFDLSNQCVCCVAEWCKALAVYGLGAG